MKASLHLTGLVEEVFAGGIWVAGLRINLGADLPMAGQIAHVNAIQGDDSTWDGNLVGVFAPVHTSAPAPEASAGAPSNDQGASKPQPNAASSRVQRFGSRPATPAQARPKSPFSRPGDSKVQL